ncbi:uncharacterized protein [Spinacia oleracea]|uniref:ATP-dependent DNA helicase n=1 Tax=Spinacia oleracea TaxID=3562 RepID=A0ABM3R854_SPIOL|nr:uncharacterized protein LOC130467328 [Spinacia oleracea]
MHVDSPRSFDHLRTVDGYKCATFQETALRLKLLEEDNAVDLCLAEAYFRHQIPSSDSKSRELIVRSVEQSLEAMGKSFRDFGLQHLNDFQDEEFRRTKDIIDALDAPIPQDCIDARNTLNQAQQDAFDSIIDHVLKGKPGAFFIDGPGGTGKTFQYNSLYEEVRLMNKIVLPTATSGIAASNIPSGRTAQSRFKIPIDSDASLACDVPKQGSLACLIKETSLIIWDEASMARKENVESLDMLLRDLCDENALFGGKLVVFGGDFRSTSLKMSGQEKIPTFLRFLLSLGNGELQIGENDLVKLPMQIVHPSEVTSDPIAELTAIAFPEIDVRRSAPGNFTTTAILTPLNEDVDVINATLIDKFPGESVMYRTFVTVLDDNSAIYPPKFIHTLYQAE